MGIACPLKRQCTCVECFKPVKVVIALCPAVGDIGWDDDDDFFIWRQWGGLYLMAFEGSSKAIRQLFARPFE